MTAQTERMREALERIADPRNTHFAGDAQVVAREALAQPPAPEQQAPQEDGAPAGSGGWKPHAERMERERDYWHARAQAMYEHQRGEVWYGQGDGEDHLESMVHTLPIVIRAEQLRELLAASPAEPEAAKPATERAALVNRLLSLLDDQTLVLEEDQEDIIKEAAALLAADSKAVGEPDWKHSTIQGVMGANARNRITIDLIWKVIENPECELTPRDMEYWDAIHDALKAALTRPKQQQAKPLSDEKRDFMVLEHLGPAALTGGTMSIYDAFMLGIDAAETEHGIGKDNAS